MSWLLAYLLNFLAQLDRSERNYDQVFFEELLSVSNKENLPDFTLGVRKRHEQSEWEPPIAEKYR